MQCEYLFISSSAHELRWVRRVRIASLQVGCNVRVLLASLRKRLEVGQVARQVLAIVVIILAFASNIHGILCGCRERCRVSE